MRILALDKINNLLFVGQITSQVTNEWKLLIITFIYLFIYLFLQNVIMVFNIITQ